MDTEWTHNGVLLRFTDAPFIVFCPTIELGIPSEHSIYTPKSVCAFCLFLHRAPSKSPNKCIDNLCGSDRQLCEAEHRHRTTTLAFTCTRRMKTESMVATMAPLVRARLKRVSHSKRLAARHRESLPGRLDVCAMHILRSEHGSTMCDRNNRECRRIDHCLCEPDQFWLLN